MKYFLAAVMALGLALLTGCAQPLEHRSNPVAELAQAIEALDPSVDPQEARRAAEISYSYSAHLAQSYGVTTAPLVHNSKVNAGLKERGLCYHYAEDMQVRLNQEGFQTLTMLRAIAEPRNPLFIDHSTTVIAANGSGIYEGIVLDAWRHGGQLFWVPTLEDKRYDWEPREKVLLRKRARRLSEQATAL